MRTRSIALGFVAALALTAPAPVAADVDTTPPVGSVSVVHDDRTNELVRLSVPATDDASGVATVEVSSDGVTWASFPYAAEVDWAAFDPGSGGEPGFGSRPVRVRWTDGIGNVSAPVTTTLYLSQGGALEFPVPPVTGQLFTIRPIYKPGEVTPPSGYCSWELVWGNNDAIKNRNLNETYGSLYTSGSPSGPWCGDWTFQIPWVPFPQFMVVFNAYVWNTDDDPFGQPAMFYPSAGSTGRRINSSTLPIVQVLPDDYTIIVGEPTTYRAYPIGVTLKPGDTWIAVRPGGGGFLKKGGTSFTFTPDVPGSWFMTWSGTANRPFTVNASYDPPARRRDFSRPNTTPPVVRLAPGAPGTGVPVSVTWSGSDVGWGIAKFQLQRSVDGGTWHGLALPTPKTKTIVQALPLGHDCRYRVRAVDKYGNVGSWDYGQTFRPWHFGDGNLAVTYGGTWTPEPDAGALGGSAHVSTNDGAWARLKFIGSDVGWVSKRGPAEGTALIYVDGTLRATVDLAAASETPGVFAFRAHWPAVGTHVIRVVVEGTDNVTVDGFIVLR